jgi:hypothetical protein
MASMAATVDIEPSMTHRFGFLPTTTATTTTAAYQPESSSALRFPGPWLDAAGRPDFEVLDVMRQSENYYLVDWFDRLPKTTTADDNLYQQRQIDGCLIKLALIVRKLRTKPAMSSTIPLAVRLQTVEWLLQKASALELPREVVHRSVSLLDRCIAADRCRRRRHGPTTPNSITICTIQIVATACLYLSASVFDVNTEWNPYDFGYDQATDADRLRFPQRLKDLSIAVSGVVCWRFAGYSTAIEWLHAYLSLSIDLIWRTPSWLFPNNDSVWLPADIDAVFVDLNLTDQFAVLVGQTDPAVYLSILSEAGTYNRICHLLDLALMDAESSSFAPSELAAAAVLVTFGPRMVRVLAEAVRLPFLSSPPSLSMMIPAIRYVGLLRSAIPYYNSDDQYVAELQRPYPKPTRPDNDPKTLAIVRQLRNAGIDDDEYKIRAAIDETKTGDGNDAVAWIRSRPLRQITPFDFLDGLDIYLFMAAREIRASTQLPASVVCIVLMRFDRQIIH